MPVARRSASELVEGDRDLRSRGVLYGGTVDFAVLECKLVSELRLYAVCSRDLSAFGMILR